MKNSTLQPEFWCNKPYNCTGFIINQGHRVWLTRGIDKVWRKVRAKGHAEQLELMFKSGELTAWNVEKWKKKGRLC